MGNLKTCVTKKHELEYLLSITETFSTNIQMKYEINRCITNSMEKAKHKTHSDYHVTRLQKGKL